MLASGLWLIGLAAALLLAPRRAARFLTGFAATARAHYTEQALRLVAGAAFVAAAPAMRFSGPVRIFGWILIATAAALILLPWRWHQRFGEKVIPIALRHKKLHAFGALILGALVLYAAL